MTQERVHRGPGNGIDTRPTDVAATLESRRREFGDVLGALTERTAGSPIAGKTAAGKPVSGKPGPAKK